MKHLRARSARCWRCATAAFGACPEKMQRDPSFMALAVEDNAPRPQSVEDFKFIGDTTTLDELEAKVGPPEARRARASYLYCLADGTIVEVESRTGEDIRLVRVNGKTVYKREEGEVVSSATPTMGPNSERASARPSGGDQRLEIAPSR